MTSQVLSSRELGEAGEHLALTYLLNRGYAARHIGGNNPIFDIAVDGSKPFRVSVKTSGSRLHVRLGQLHMLRQMRDDDIVVALLPTCDNQPLDLRAGRHLVLVAPGKIAREDGLAVSEAWLAGTTRDGRPRSPSAGAMLKFYKKSGLHPGIWRRWQAYNNNWSVLPPPN